MSLQWVISYVLTSLKTCAKQLLQHDERLCFTSKLVSVHFATSKPNLQCHLPLMHCTKPTVHFRVVGCCLFPLPQCLQLVFGWLQHGAAASGLPPAMASCTVVPPVAESCSLSLRQQTQQDGGRGGALTAQAGPFQKARKESLAPKWSILNCQIKKIISAVFKQKN